MQDLSLNKEITCDEEILTKNNVFVLAGALLMGFLVNMLFYDKALGISYPIFVLAFYSIFFFLFRDKLSFKLNFGWLLCLPVICLSSTYVLFTNPVFAFFNFFAVPLLLVSQTIILTGNAKHSWTSVKFAVDIFLGFFLRPLAYIYKPFSLISKMLYRRKESRRLHIISKIGTGLIISIPLLAIVVMLLASADQVFDNLLGKLPDFFVEFDLYSLIVRSVLVIVVTVLSFSYFWSLRCYKPADGKDFFDTSFRKPAWDQLTVATVVFAVNIVYVIFVAIQFTYLFGGASAGLPAGFNYSEYARRGFFELVAVTVINLSILLGCINFAKSGGTLLNKLLRILYSLLVLCTFVMLVSAHFRMSLYEQTYGYTYLRVFTHAFMVFIFALLALALWKVWNDRILLVKYYIITAVIAYLIINFMNVDAFIAKNNIERYIYQKENNISGIDAAYLTTLSYEAVPYLTELLEDEDENTVRIIENHLYSLKEELKNRKEWQSFNISRKRAADILENYSLECKAMRSNE